MLGIFGFVKRLAVLFALAAVLAGCGFEFSDTESPRYANGAAPEIPKNVRVRALSPTSIRVSWEPVPVATEYRVYWSATRTGDYEELARDIPGTSYVDDECDPETTYYYKVTAFVSGKSAWESRKSAEAHATTLAEGETPVVEVIPDPPTNVSASPSSPTRIMVAWNSVANAAGYNVYSSSSADGYYTFRAFVEQYSSPVWNDNDCQPGQTKYYRITTLQDDEESEKSDHASATTETVMSNPSAPTGVAAQADGTTITVTWDPVSNAASYSVYRTPSAGSTPYMGTVTSTTYVDMGLTPGTTYSYYIIALNSYGASENSTTASATAATSGGGTPGSSAATAIELFSSAATWIDGTVNAATPAVWYRFYIPDNDTYCLMGRDVWGYGAPYTGDVSFEIYDSGLTLIRTLDAGNGGSFESPGGSNGYNYQKGTWTPGWWYVKAVPYNGNTGSYGTYAIYFY
jgi:fibronectin type 3 domain-containing protein